MTNGLPRREGRPRPLPLPAAPDDVVRLVAKGVLLSPRVWNLVARDLNTVAQLSADSKNAEKIARRCERIKRVLRGKPSEPQRRKRGRRRRRY